MSVFCSVQVAAEQIAAGRSIVLVDDRPGNPLRANLVLGAELARPESVAFMVRHTSGFVRVAVTPETCARLVLPQMVYENQSPHGIEYTVTVDAAEGVSTGISARDRARTIRLLASSRSVSADLTRPGHVLPMRARAGGLLERRGFAEALIDLTRLAGLSPAGATSELVGSNLSPHLPERAEVLAFAREHGLNVLHLDELVEHRWGQNTAKENASSTA